MEEITLQEIYELALDYCNGTNNCEQDLGVAAFYFFIAADGGHEQAKEKFKSVKEYIDLNSVQNQENLGLFYMGIGDNIEKSIYWFEKASVQGHAYSTYMLGEIYSWTDQEKGMEYYHKAYELGSPDAAYILGSAYEKGNGVEVDYAKAIQYYNFAVEGGYPPAMMDLASMYEEGRGVEVDVERAAALRQMADFAAADIEISEDDIHISRD